MNAWLIVLIAGVLETGWAMGLKYSEGFTRPIPSIVTIVLALASFWMLSVAMKTLPVGTAYAVWVGIGALGTAIAAVFLFAEPVNTLRVAERAIREKKKRNKIQKWK